MRRNAEMKETSKKVKAPQKKNFTSGIYGSQAEKVLAKAIEAKAEKVVNSNKSKDESKTVNDSAVFLSGLSKGSQFVAVLNAYPNGISASIHRAQDAKNIPIYELHGSSVCYDPFFLRTRDTRELPLPEGKFLIFRESYREDLERFFDNLKKKNILESLTVYFGVANDPFHGFHKKFAQVSTCLEMLEKYKPARVVIQSRSRMLLTCLPTLKFLGEDIFCVIPFETRLEKVIARYTPGQPRLEERLITAAGLQAQGIKIAFSVSPLLPYGETSGDTWKFAELLCRYSDLVLIQPLCNGTRENELTISKMPISHKLDADQQVHFLRPHADEQLRSVIQKLSANHLLVPPLQNTKKEAQLKLFAA